MTLSGRWRRFRRDFLRCRIPVPPWWGGLPGSSRGISFWTFAARREEKRFTRRIWGAQVEARDLTERKIGSCGRKRGALRILQCPYPCLGRQSVGSVHGRTGGHSACGSSLFGSWDHGQKAGNPAAFKEEELFTLAGLQREILAVVSRYVKPGGTLIYSTCTISREENEENAGWIEQESSLSAERDRAASSRQCEGGLQGKPDPAPAGSPSLRRVLPVGFYETGIEWDEENRILNPWSFRS